MIKKALWVVVPTLALLSIVALMVFASQGVSMQILDTKGIIADRQRDTLYASVAIMSIIIIPVLLLVIWIPIRYRETNKKTTYSPNWATSRRLETIWWGVPIVIVAVLSVLTWQTSQELDPYKPLVSDKNTLNVQVVSLQWKWLFLYPEYGVASVGEFAMPINRPVSFALTSDAPMNSFWIPQLAGQIYAMPGMTTSLNLNAREVGDYRGTSANISGKGHSGMTFTAKARSEQNFTEWIEQTREKGKALDSEMYNTLREPSLKNGVNYYQLANESLFDEILSRYQTPGSSNSHKMGAY